MDGLVARWRVAVKGNNTAAIKDLLKSRTRPPIMNEKGDSFLHFAVELGHVETIHVLLQSDVINVNVPNLGRYSPLHFAVICKQYQLVDVLLSYGADVDWQNHLGDTPLHEAVKNEDLHLIEDLLNQGADPNLRNCYGYSAFESSIDWASLVVIELFLKFGAKLQDRMLHHPYGNLLHMITAYSNFEIMRKLVELGGLKTDVLDAARNHPLHLLMQRQDLSEVQIIEILRQFVIAGANLNWYNNKFETAIQLAAKRRLGHVVEYLLDSGARVDGHKKNLAISNALRKLDLNVCRLLLSRGGSLPSDALFIFLDAIIASRLASPLYAKIQLCEEEMELFRLLLASGAQMNCKNRKGESPLHAAIGWRADEVAELLLDKGAEVNGSDAQSKATPIMTLAVWNGNKKLVLRMLQGATPAIVASACASCVVCGNVELFRSLLSLGVVQLDNKQCLEYLKVAIKYMYFAMVEFLLLAIGPDAVFVSEVALQFVLTCYATDMNLYSTKVVKVLVQHVALARGSYEQTKNLELMNSREWVYNYYMQCRDEADRLAKTRISDEYPLTYGDFIGKRNNALIKALRCNEIKKQLASGKHKNMFVHYSDMLDANVIRGLSMKQGVDKFENLLYDVLGDALPIVVIRKISEYYNDVDFIKL